MDYISYEFRDGTSQQGRMNKCLDPSYVSVYERKKTDFIKSARDLSLKLKYYNKQNEPAGNWGSIFNFSDEEIGEIETIINNPKEFSENHKLHEQISKPHIALFLAFLKLMDYPLRQFNNITFRHLDYYYRNILLLKERVPEPDSVHVLFETAADVEEQLIEKGTLFDAGKNQNGNDILYELNDDIIINRAKVSGISSIKVIKEEITLKSIHSKFKRSNTGFRKMLEFALGSPEKEDPLPEYINAKGQSEPVDESFLFNLYNQIKGKDDEKIDNLKKNYILNWLGFLRIDDFRTVLDVHSREIRKGERGVTAPTDREWENVYSLVELAYKKRVTMGRRSVLQEIHQNDGFNSMMEHALGDPSEGDKLPVAPSSMSLNDLYGETMKTQVPDVCIKYVEKNLFMTVDNFRTIMKRESSEEEKSDQSVSWEEIYRLLEKAWTKKRNFRYPQLKTRKISDIVSSLIKDDKQKHYERFPAFGSNLQNDGNSEIGFAVSSEILDLNEGDREITINIECSEKINIEKLKEIVSNQPHPFILSVSTLEGWTEVDSYTIDAGNFLLQDKVAAYSSKDMRLILSGSKLFKKGIKYVRFPDGSIYQIERKSDDKAEAVSAGKDPADGALHVAGSISVETGEELKGKFEFDPDKEELISSNENFNSGNKGAFILLADGKVYRIKDFYDAKRVCAEYRGEIEKSDKKVFLLKSITYPDDKIISSDVSVTGVISDNTPFKKEDINKYLLWNNGLVLLISGFAGSNELVARSCGFVYETGKTELYDSNSVGFNSLMFRLSLSQKVPPLFPSEGFQNPAIKMILEKSDESNEFNYEYFRNLKIKKIILCVRAHNLKELKLRNDKGLINPKTPFEPFGNPPLPGSGFYIAAKEICEKKLDSLNIDIQWMNLPESFKSYYDSYVRSKVIDSVSDNDFCADLKMMDNRSLLLIAKGRNLFKTTAENNHLISDVRIESGNITFEGYKDKRVDALSDDPADMERFFKLELNEPGFFFELYNLAMNRIALLNMKETDPEKIIDLASEPYIPKVKDISVSYTASSRTDLKDDLINFYHVDSFGMEKKYSKEEFPYLIRDYDNEGYLNIGFENCRKKENQSVLFQFVEGTGDPLIEQPEIVWDYLSESGWKKFNDRDILSDETKSMSNSGILKFSIPDDTAENSPIMPGNLTWIRGKANSGTEAVADLIDISSQAARLTFKGEKEDSSNTLSAYSIKGLKSRIPAVKEVLQPYSSWGGRPPESNTEFFSRVSERLRHRQRAVNIWDYERIVLDKFPDIYKVKCIRDAEYNNRTNPNEVVVVVIPDISNTKPFFPLEPRVPANVLKKIEEYLKGYASPFVKLTVKNPSYEKIKYRVAVKFKDGSSQGIYLKKINEDLKQFLSPWAYEEQADISFGSKIYSASVIHFLEKRPYVDYIAKLKLIEHTVGKRVSEFGESKDPSSDIAMVNSPDAILVSSDFHIIDIITSDNYDEEEFEGIGYMIIGTDFRVNPPDPESKTIGFMSVGKDFEIK